MANLSTHTSDPSRRFNFIYNDDEDSTIPLNEIISQIPPSIAITPVLPTMKPEDSLIMRDENLCTIPKKESDEFIKSSVEDLVPIPSESEDTSDSDKECDLPFCDNSVTFSNPLFNDNDDFTSSDDYDVHPLFNKIEACLTSDSIPPRIDGADFDLEGDILLFEKLLNNDISFSLPPKELNFEELKVIKSDVSTDFKDDYYDSEGDIIYLERFLIKDTISNIPPEVFLDHDPRSLEDELDKYPSCYAWHIGSTRIRLTCQYEVRGDRTRQYE
ncbi:hypothetical protein Tco_1431270, partial [Tanacetum coccineum]